MTDTSKKSSTLSIGGTLSVSGSSGAASAGVTVEVRRRRFAEAETETQAATGSTGNEELDRRLQALEDAKKNAATEAKKRAEDRERVASLQQKRDQEIADKKAKEAEEELSRAKEAAEKEREAVEKVIASQPTSAPTKETRKPSLGEQFKKKSQGNSGRPAAKSTGKKRGRNAYLGDLEQRYRSMPGRARKNARKGVADDVNQQEKVMRDVEIPDFITVGDLAARMSEKAGDVVKKLMMMGEMVTLNQTIDQETSILIVEEFGHTYKLVSEADIEEGLVESEDKKTDLKERPPIVTVMGHVDHGKTTLLDALRKTDVVKGEAGGITQHIGAYQVTLKSGRKMTFLDTPGHAAFTAMRARGAQVTDIVILVVAADDGIMPQTIEAIQHAKSAEVPIVVAINKMDKDGADPQRVKNELLSHELVLEDFGGEVPCVEISALKGQGLEDLQEVVLLQADVLELKANPSRRADGAVVEAELDKGRGSVATVVVQRGTLRVGDTVVAGSVWGRVRALVNDAGETIQEAGPSVPVEILGLQGVPEAGDSFLVAENERRAKEVAEFRHQKRREKQQASRKLSLDSMFDRMASGDVVELNMIVKADVQGSVEAIKHSLEQLNTKQVKVNVIHGGVGVVTETDINLAMASNALVVGFSVRSDANARKQAEKEGVEIRYYTIIYELIDDVKAAMGGLLSPDYEEISLGGVEIRQMFKFGKIRIAGCMVTDGVVKRNNKARIVRDGTVVYDGTIATLRREKDDVKEVKSGYECGMTFENYDDFAEGDMVEVYALKEIKKSLDDIRKSEKIADKKAKDAADLAALEAEEAADTAAEKAADA